MKYIFIFILICFSLLAAKSQNIAYTDDYIQNPFLYNPARAGLNTSFGEKIDQVIVISHRNYWLPTSNNGGLQTATFNTGLKEKNIGLGLSIFNQNAHILSKAGIVLSYNYDLSFGDKDDLNSSKLSLGLSTSFMNQRLDLENGNIYDQTDEALLSNSWEGSYLNFGSGLTYRVNRFELDLSVSNWLGLRFGNEDAADPFNTNHNGKRLNIFGSMRYTWNVNEKYRFQPIFSMYREASLPYELALMFMNQVRLNNVKILTGIGLELKSGEAKSNNLPIGITSNIGVEIFDKFSFTMFFGTLTNYYQQAGYDIGIQASYRIFNKK